MDWINQQDYIQYDTEYILWVIFKIFDFTYFPKYILWLNKSQIFIKMQSLILYFHVLIFKNCVFQINDNRIKSW